MIFELIIELVTEIPMVTILKHISVKDIPQHWAKQLHDPLDGCFRITIEAEESGQETSGIGIAARKAAGLWRDRKDLDNKMSGIRTEFDRSFTS